MPGADGLIYEDWVAEFYDAWFGDWLDSGGIVARLAELAGSGPALELGVGTGRVALPLAAHGVDVHGIDASEAMVARLRAKPGGERIPVTLSDFSAFAVDARFSLVYVAAGTFFELQSQQAQVRCFGCVARHLTPDGTFVLDGLVPDGSRDADAQGVKVIPSRPGQLIVRFREVDRVAERYVSHYVVMGDQGMRLLSVPFRFAWPSELDLMATMAGLRLRQRTGGWRGEPFTAASQSHVSVYERDS